MALQCALRTDQIHAELRRRLAGRVLLQRMFVVLEYLQKVLHLLQRLLERRDADVHHARQSYPAFWRDAQARVNTHVLNRFER
jgi:hypothetical protein